MTILSLIRSPAVAPVELPAISRFSVSVASFKSKDFLIFNLVYPVQGGLALSVYSNGYS